MLNLDKQEHLRLRYKTSIRPGYQLGLDVYRSRMAAQITHETYILDLGCGPAGLVAEHRDQAALIVGMDQYLTNFSEFDGQFEIDHLAEGDGEKIPFADMTFDLVTSSWVLEHLRDPQRVMDEVVRVLKPGGRFLFITPNALNYVVVLRRLVPEARSKGLVKLIYDRDEDFINPTFYRMNTPQQVIAIAQQAGLKPVVVETISDPTYLAFNEMLFQASIIIERLMLAVFPNGAVHLIGEFEKPR